MILFLLNQPQFYHFAKFSLKVLILRDNIKSKQINLASEFIAIFTKREMHRTNKVNQ